MKTGLYKFGECHVIVTNNEPIKRGEVGWHLSISHPSRLPTYEELKEARYRFCPDEVHMAQIFPPKSEFVNVHQFCLHLYEI